MAKARPSDAHVALAIYIVCFLIGIASHGRDFIAAGWRPYRWAPPSFETFWTSLIALDLLVVGLLSLGWRRSGLCLALTVMTFDVAANTYALLSLHIASFTLPLILQAAFFGFVLGSIGFLWPKSSVST